MEANRSEVDRLTDDERAQFDKSGAAGEPEEDEVAQAAGGAKPGQGAHADDDPARPTDAAPKADDDDEADEAFRAHPRRALLIINVSAARAWEAAKKAMDYLVKANVPIYVRGEELVQPVTEEGRGHKGQPVKVTTLVAMDDIRIKSELLEHIKWQQQSSDGPRNMGPGRDVPRMILRARKCWPFKQLKGLSTTPTLRPDGSLLSEPGYDPVTQMLLVDLPRMPPINSRASPEEAEAALALLKELFEEFPFVDEASRSVSLSLLLSAVARGALVFVPLHLFRAPEAGSGKSYLIDIVSMITTGERCPVLAATNDPGEFEKRLAAAMQSGRPLINMDNLNGTLESSLLCQAITQSPVQYRPLGTSVDRMITNRSVFTANGNNIAIVDDLGRRTLMAQLDAHTEKPWERSHKKDPMKMIAADRGRYVAACLTIMLAYRAADLPLGGRLSRVNGFEEWSWFVREPLVWLGMADPVETMQAARKDDPKLQAKAAVFNAMVEQFGLGPENAKTAAEMVKETRPSIDAELNGDKRSNAQRTALHEALMAVAGAGREIRQKDLGYWFRDAKGQIAGGLRLEGKLNRRNTTEWWLEEAKDG